MKILTDEFNGLMQTIADGWIEGNARTPALPLAPLTCTACRRKCRGCFAMAGGAREAADGFGEDVIYMEPPGKQLYHGRAELYEFFGGDSGTDIPMKMVWHHLAFNEEEQIGFGEYTFEMHRRYHDIVVVKVESGLVKQWREYQYQSELNWEEFTSHNPF